MRAWASGALAALVIASPARAGESLTGEQITSALSGRVTTGYQDSGSPYRITYQADGTQTLQSGKFFDTGKWVVRGNQLCLTWNKKFSGQEQCYLVSRDGNTISYFHPDGSASGTSKIEN